MLWLAACTADPQPHDPVVPVAPEGFDLGGVVPRTIVVVHVDTLRADATPWGGSTRATFPYMAGRSGWVSIDHAIAEGTWTAPSTASLMTGVGQEWHGVRAFPDDAPPPHVTAPTWPMLLDDAGWETALLSGGELLTRPDLGLAAGFDFVEQVSDDPGNADAMLGEASAWLHARDPDAQALLFLQPVDPHGPYRPEETDAGTWVDPDTLPFDPSDPGDMQEKAILAAVATADDAERAAILDAVRRAYDEQLLGLDRALRSVFYMLEEDGRLDDAVVVLSADHGESFYEGPPEWFGHGMVVRHEIVHVPLLFWTAQSVETNLDCVASNLDVFPTLGAMLGMEPPEGTAGRSLFDGCRETAFSAVYEQVDGADVLTGVGVETAESALVRTCDGESYAFDLTTDPLATVPVTPPADLEGELDGYVTGLAEALGPVSCPG